MSAPLSSGQRCELDLDVLRNFNHLDWQMKDMRQSKPSRIVVFTIAAAFAGLLGAPCEAG